MNYDYDKLQKDTIASIANEINARMVKELEGMVMDNIIGNTTTTTHTDKTDYMHFKLWIQLYSHDFGGHFDLYSISQNSFFLDTSCAYSVYKSLKGIGNIYQTCGVKIMPHNLNLESFLNNYEAQWNEKFVGGYVYNKLLRILKERPNNEYLIVKRTTKINKLTINPYRNLKHDFTHCYTL